MPSLPENNSPNSCSVASAHWWRVGQPITRFSRKGQKGDLVEYTHQQCKYCGETRLNRVVLPPEPPIPEGGDF